jgi:histidinol-phosphate aminotransferase
MMDKVREGKNVIISRTFSKCYGLAGCRVGYMISNPEIITHLKRHSLQNFSLSRLGLAAAMVSYDDQEFLSMVREKLAASKAFLYDFLTARQIPYYPSVTHYVNFDIKMDGEKFKKAMLAEGVTVSTSVFRDKQQCNITLGTMDEMKVFKEAFNKVYKEEITLSQN